MKRDSSKPVDPDSQGHAGTSREAVLEAVRSAVEASGSGRVSLKEFLTASGMNWDDVFGNFARWKDVLQAAGYDFKPHNAPIEPERLLEDWGAVARDLERAPTKAEYGVRGKYSSKTLEIRFGGWSNVPNAFREFASEKAEWADLRPLIPATQRRHARRRPASMTAGRFRGRRWVSGRKRRAGAGPVYGAPLNAGTLQHAPLNENGVIFLFGTMAERLGFLVEAVRTEFPDCEAKREIAPGVWESVQIEFEYESRNFRLHGHDAQGCGIIVCWAHNWPECPLEVIELKGELARFRGEINPRDAKTRDEEKT